MKRVYCLYRVSTLGQVEKDDIPMQRQVCHEFVAKQNNWQIVKEYSEKGVSGFKISAKDRDVIQDIQKAAVEKRFDILLVFMFDRIGRREDETPFVVEWFTQQGIEVWSTHEGQQRFDSHVDKLMNYIRFWQASGESIKTSVRTKTRMGQLVQEGHFRGGNVPYGYRLVKKGRLNKKMQEVNDIEIHPEESETVKMIFDKYVYEGFGMHRIIAFLENNGIRNHNGNLFSFSSIRNMLQSVIYIGVLKSGDTFSEVFPHLQIVDSEIFDKAQKIKIERTKEFTAVRRVPLNTKGESLLSGNIFCAECGGRLSLTTSGKSYTKKDGTVVTNKRIRYICYNKSRKICACNGQTGYTMSKLDGIISELLMNLFDSVKCTPERELIEKRYHNELAVCKNKLKSTKSELKKHTDSLKTLQDEVINAIQGTSKFESGLLNDLIIQTKEKVTTAENEVKRHELELDSKQQHMTEIQSQYKSLISWADIFQDSNKETRKMITAYLIESVRVRRGYEVDVKFHVAYEQFCNAV